jgi:GxxExxY protein
MAGKRIETPYDALTYQIIGCAMATHRRLGPGLREDTYQRDLEVQFTGSTLSYEPQRLKCMTPLTVMC